MILKSAVGMKRRHCPVMLALGFFDGVHRGHQGVIRSAVKSARETGGEAWVMTFGTHPQKVLSPGKAPLLLTCNRHRLLILERTGVDGCILQPFTRRLAGMAPETFVRKLAHDIPSLKRIFIGRNWRFGRNEAGDAGLMSLLGASLGFGVTVVPPVKLKGRMISSTRIRSAILAGNFRDAEAQLGRPFSIIGKVVHGRGIGRKIGFPTANLKTENEAIPPPGVYAVQALFSGGRMAGRRFAGAMNIGYRPTFSRGGKRLLSIELNMIGFRRAVYGRTVEVFFLSRIRGERRFLNAEKLARRIVLDLKAVKKIARVSRRRISP